VSLKKTKNVKYLHTLMQFTTRDGRMLSLSQRTDLYRNISCTNHIWTTLKTANVV